MSGGWGAGGGGPAGPGDPGPDGDSTGEGPPLPPRETEAPEARRFPTAFTVLLAVLVAVWALTFVVPPGAYRYVRCDGASPRPIPGSYQRSDEAPAAFGERLMDLWLSPVTGLYGVRELPAPVESPTASLATAAAETCGEGASFEVVGSAGNTGAYNAGSLSGAAQVFFFVLAIGGFIGITLRTGALEAGIAAMTHRFRDRGPLLLALLTAAFALGGSTYGMAEETLGFYAVLVPVLLGLGYDRMVAVGVILVGSGIGTLASTVNPFATGVASGIAGVPLGEGLGLRLAMWVVLTTTAILYIQRYAARVREAPGRSLAPGAGSGVPVAWDGAPGLSAAAPAGFAAGSGGAAAPDSTPEFTLRQRRVLWLFGLTFALMIFSVVPWSDFSPSLEPVTLAWYFPELAALFLVAAVAVGMLSGLGEERTVGGILAGMGEFLGAALIIALARGVTVVMNNAGVTDTILHSLEATVSAMASGGFALMMFVVNLPLAFLVPSTSGHATLAMPVLAPLGDFAGVSRAVVVTAYQSASGWVNLVTPTSAIVMGGLALAGVRFDRYLRFMAPLMLLLLPLIGIFLVMGVVLG